MTYVATKLCRDCVDRSCMNVCPVDCFHFYSGDDPGIPKNQILIDPEECIDCDACVTECPWGAIFSEADLPEIFSEDLAINALIVAGNAGIENWVDEPAIPIEKPVATPEAIAANNERHEYTP